MLSRYTPLALGLFLIASVAAQDEAAIKTVPSRAPALSASAGGGCNTGNAETRLDEGGVEANLFNVGALFWKGADYIYEVPQGFGTQAIFAAGIWIGGEVGGDLRFAGSDYGPYEFWPGPLDANGEVTSDTCFEFDRLWTVTQADIEAYGSGGSPTADMQDWPIAWGAPFYTDANGNDRRDDNEAVTELDLGDPGYGTRTIDLGAGERPLVYGSETVWWVMNDNGNAHDWSEEEALKIEVRVAAFGVADPSQPELDQSTFYRYTVINRSADTIQNGRLGFWADADLGFFQDDYVGSDEDRGMLFFYNGDEIDEGEFGYGTPPPALGIDWLSGASAAMTYANATGTGGNPTNGAEAYAYLGAECTDNGTVIPVREGGQTACAGTGAETEWAFGGDPVTGSFWSMENTDGSGTPSVPSDQRGIVSSDEFTLAPGASQTFDLAIVYARGADRLGSVTALRAADDAVQALYDSGDLFDAVSPVQNPPPAAAPASAPSLLAPADGEVFTEGSVPFSWTAVPDAEWYLFNIPGGSPIRVQGTSFDLPREAVPINRQDPFSWTVRAANRAGNGPHSENRTFTYYIFESGVLFLTGGRPAFVETVSPSGIDPCGPDAASTMGCTETGGNGVQNSFNSDLTYVMGVLGPVGTEGSLGVFAPHDYEIRFTAEGSYAYHGFTTGALIQVPFEVWDVGDEPPFSNPDPSDDVQMVPVLFSDNDGVCDFNFGEGEIFGRPATDRIYAYYAADADGDGDSDNADYAAYEVLAAAAVAADPNGCPADPATAQAANQIDFATGRPIQRQVFADNTDSGDISVLQNTVVKFYTTPGGPGGGGSTNAESDPDAVAVLGVAHPNPTRGALTVPYRLRQPAQARVAVYDALGREVAVLARGTHAPGAYEATLDTSSMAAGVYTVLLEAGEARAIQRVVIVR